MKTKIALIITTTILSFTGFAQESSPEIPSSILKFNPFELISSTFMVELESFNKEGSKSFSVGIGATYAEQPDYGNEKVAGIKGELIHRVYISPFSQKTSKKGRDYLLGIYGGLFVRGGYEQIEHEFSSYDQIRGTSVLERNVRKGSWIFPGAMIGLSRTYWDRLLIDVYLGGGIRAIQVEDSNTNYDDSYGYYNHISPLDFGGVAPNIGLKIGLWL